MRVERKRVLAMAVIVILAVFIIFAVYSSLRHASSPIPLTEAGYVSLPPPDTVGSMSVEEAISKRRSIRNYADEPLTVHHLSQLLWSAQGITDPGQGLRAAPSAGATYPLEVYIVVGLGGVEGLDPGVYRYDPRRHCLTLIAQGDLRENLSNAALNQKWIAEAPVDLVIAAEYERTTGRYGDRGVRYVHMEAGHVAENIYLQATALRLGVVTVGAFDDEAVQRLLSLPSSHKPLYIIPVGHPRL
ncbi:MAG: SagB/ThcOx family dehydrogenase [Candidatus Bathyarchaeia archaeon]